MLVLKVELRVQDLSRQASTRGTEIPVIDETKAAQKAIELLAVPKDPQFRALLRIYDFDPAAGHSAIVRIFRPQDPTKPGDELLKEITVPFLVPVAADYSGYPGYPGY